MANFYWYGGTGDWSDFANHWSSNSGNTPAAPAANAPTLADDVFIDANSGFGAGGTITLDTDATMHNFLANSGHTYTILNNVGDFHFYGSITFEAGITDNGCSLYFDATDTGHTVTLNGATFTGGDFASFDGVGGGWTLLDDFSVDDELDLSNGTFDANDHNIKVSRYYLFADTGFTPTVIMGSGTWEMTGGANAWRVVENNGQVVTIIPETSTIKFAGIDFIGGGKTYYNLWITGGAPVISGDNTFNNIRINAGITVKFLTPITTTVSSFIATGTVGNLITLDSVDGVTQFTLTKASNSVVCDYLDLSNSNATGGALWYAGSHSSNTANNTGWIFTDPPNAPSPGVISVLLSGGII